MSWHGETNPHFWPRDPPQPSGHQPAGPSRQQPGGRSRHRERPSHIRLPPPAEPVSSGPRIHQPEDHPGRKLKPKDHARLPAPTVGPVISHPQQPQPDPRAHQPAGPSRQHPEYELTPVPAGRDDPELVIPPKSKDHWPMHPHEASEDHWPLHPHQASQDGPTTQPHPHPKKHQPHPPRKQGPPPKQPDHVHRPHVGPAAGRPPPRRHGLPAEQQPHHGRLPREQNLIYPSPHRTNPCTWFIAVFCVILWVVIILGGILILIIYLVYRPRSPHFEISDASLNAAYLDMGYLLNADLTLLVNFTNPNEKMSVDFNFIVLKLRYENHLIANQYIEPFDAGKLEHKFARVEMVSSQIRLPVLVTQQLIKQIQGNRITFELDGYFHARSRLGSIFRYSYWLYSHCTIITKGPPTGVVVFSKCITKR